MKAIIENGGISIPFVVRKNPKVSQKVDTKKFYDLLLSFNQILNTIELSNTETELRKNMKDLFQDFTNGVLITSSLIAEEFTYGFRSRPNGTYWMYINQNASEQRLILVTF